MEDISVKKECQEISYGGELADSVVQNAMDIKCEENTILKTNNHGFEEIIIKEEPNSEDSDNQIKENCNDEISMSPSKTKCPICDKIMMRRSLKKHLRNIHSSNIHREVMRHPCQLCNKTFTDSRSLKYHIGIHTGQREKFECSICSKSYTLKSTLNKHLNSHTTNFIKEEKKKKECPICGKLIQVINMRKHIRAVHKKIKKFHCNLCNKSFAGSASLKYHMAIHSGKRDKFECSICSKFFSTKSSLTKHLNIHTMSEKTAEDRAAYKNKEQKQCPICDKILSAGSLRKHINLVHKRIKKYRCNLCNKSYTESSSLKYHMTSHIGKKEFECVICHQLFPNKNALKLHVDTHVGSDSSLLIQKDNLPKRIHDRKPETERINDLECQKCDRKFTKKLYLNRHLRLHLLDDQTPTYNQMHAENDSPKDNILTVENIEDIFVKEENELDNTIVSEISNNKFDEIVIKEEPNKVNCMDSEDCNNQKENKHNE